jgi:hypothetical protein
MVFTAIANQFAYDGTPYAGHGSDRVTNDRNDFVKGQISAAERGSLLAWLDGVPLLPHDEISAAARLFEDSSEAASLRTRAPEELRQPLSDVIARIRDQVGSIATLWPFMHHVGALM